MSDNDESTIELNLAKENKLSFRIDVSGTEEAPSEARLVCVTEGLEYGFPCALSGEDLEVSIPRMEGKLNPGSYEARLEVIVEGTRFVPVKTELTFKAPVRVAVAEQRVPAPAKVKPAVSLKATYVKRKEDVAPAPAKEAAAPFADTLRKLVAEAVHEAQPRRSK